MARTLLLIGTRKGLFMLESDEARRDWTVRGPFCESWPVYHAIHDADVRRDLRRRRERVARLGRLAQRRPRRDVGALERGPRYGDDDERKVSKVSSLAVADGTRARRRRGAGHLRERATAARRWSLLTTLAGQPGQRGVGRPGEPAARATSASRRSCPTATTRAASGRSCRASACSRPTTAARRWTPRNRGLRADWPRPHEEVGFCVHRLVRSPADPDRHVPAEPRRRAPQRRRRPLVDGDHRGPAERVRLRRRGAPARPRHLLRDPARPRPRARRCPRARRPSGARATPARAGSGSTQGLPQRRRAPRRAARRR